MNVNEELKEIARCGQYRTANTPRILAQELLRTRKALEEMESRMIMIKHEGFSSSHYMSKEEMSERAKETLAASDLALKEIL